MKMRPVVLALGLAVVAVAIVSVVGLVAYVDRDDIHDAAGPVLVPNLNPPVAERRCGKRVIEDWYVDGRVDRVYRLGCYGAALGLLPTSPPLDSTVVEDITGVPGSSCGALAVPWREDTSALLSAASDEKQVVGDLREQAFRRHYDRIYRYLRRRTDERSRGRGACPDGVRRGMLHPRCRSPASEGGFEGSQGSRDAGDPIALERGSNSGGGSVSR